MDNDDRLRRTLAEFFELPPNTQSNEISQDRLPAWDSLAMVQLITELQGTFSVEFGLEEIENLRSYDEIRHSLSGKGITF